MLKLENIYGGYRENNNILKGIDLVLAENEVVALIGQNGAGKTTIAKAIMNMLPVFSGDVYFKGENIGKKSVQEIVNSGLGFFMQGGRIFPHLTIEENLSFSGMYLSKQEFQERKKEIESYFDIFEYSKKGRPSLKASYLSGGEQHLLALAMIMLKRPDFLILDEPSAGLSPGNVKKLYDSLNKIKNNNDISILLIEQNVQSAYEFSDRVTLLKQGKIEFSDMDLKDIENEYFERNKLQ